MRVVGRPRKVDERIIGVVFVTDAMGKHEGSEYTQCQFIQTQKSADVQRCQEIDLFMCPSTIHTTPSVWVKSERCTHVPGERI